jgi:hypothetical protein
LTCVLVVEPIRPSERDFLVAAGLGLRRFRLKPGFVETAASGLSIHRLARRSRAAGGTVKTFPGGPFRARFQELQFV